MHYGGGETTAAGLFPDSRNWGRWIQSSFLKSEQGIRRCLFSMEVVILDSDVDRAPILCSQLPSLLAWYQPSSVFSSFPRCLEDLISSPGLPLYPPRSCPASPKTTLIYSSYFPSHAGVTPFSGVLKYQDSLLIIVFALSNLICWCKATFSWGKRIFFNPHP